jgi:hypothetical protein
LGSRGVVDWEPGGSSIGKSRERESE